MKVWWKEILIRLIDDIAKFMFNAWDALICCYESNNIELNQ